MLLSDLTNFKQILVTIRIINLFHKHPKKKISSTQCWDDLAQIHEIFWRYVSDTELWKYSCGRVGCCVWINDSEITYPKIETSAVKINETRGNAAVLFEEMFDGGIVTLWSSHIDI
jgi:hypothetical protein